MNQAQTHRRHANTVSTGTRQRGLTLVELMVALVLGLVVIASVTTVYISNKKAFRTNAAVAQVQDGSRIAFALMARDIRQAGVTGCGDKGRIANVLNNGPNNGGTAWYANFDNALMGFDGGTADPAVTSGSGVGQRVAGTSSIEVIGAGDTTLSIGAPNGAASQLTLNQPTSDLQSGDIVIACDPDHAVITQITGIQNGGATLVHSATKGAGTPGNCSTGLGYPTSCTATGNAYQFPQNGLLSSYAASDWYIGNNPQAGRSLYRIALVNSGGVPTPTAQEMVRNVTDMQLRYLQIGNPDFVNAGKITDWTQVTAVQVALTLQSTVQRAGTDNKPLIRQLLTTVTLRNRVS